MSIASQLRARKVYEVEAGGIRWRCQRLRAGDLLRLGIPALPIAALSGGPEGEAAARAAIAARDPRDVIAEMAAGQEALVCAAVVEAFDPKEKAWEPLRIVLDGEPDEARGEVSIASLSGAMIRGLADRIRAQDAEEVGRSVAAFRSGSGADSADRSGCAPVRDPAERAPEFRPVGSDH